VAALGVACNTTDNEAFPLTAGNKWTSQGYVLRGSPAASLDTLQTMTVVTTVESQETLVSGVRVLPLLTVKSIHQLSPDSNYVTAMYQYARETGGAVLIYDSLTDPSPDTVLYQDLAVGRTWQCNSYPAEVVGQGGINVPAGDYDGAFRVRYTQTTPFDSTFTVYICFANGVGEVMRDFEAPLLPFGTRIYHTELVSAIIK
jgi:hypothetical protein